MNSKNMKIYKIYCVAFVLGALCTNAFASLTMTFKQVDADVIAITSGSIEWNYDDIWNIPVHGGELSQIGIYPSNQSITVGSIGDIVDVYNFNARGDIYFPSNSVGSFAPATSSVGDPFGWQTNTMTSQYMILPINYVSGTQISNTTTWSNKTLSDLSLEAGTEYSWWWKQSQVTGLTIKVENTPVSVPAPLPILGAVAAIGWSRKLRQRIKDLAGR